MEKQYVCPSLLWYLVLRYEQFHTERNSFSLENDRACSGWPNFIIRGQLLKVHGPAHPKDMLNLESNLPWSNSIMILSTTMQCMNCFPRLVVAVIVISICQVWFDEFTTGAIRGAGNAHPFRSTCSHLCFFAEVRVHGVAYIYSTWLFTGIFYSAEFIYRFLFLTLQNTPTFLEHSLREWVSCSTSFFPCLVFSMNSEFWLCDLDILFFSIVSCVSYFSKHFIYYS